MFMYAWWDIFGSGALASAHERFIYLSYTVWSVNGHIDCILLPEVRWGIFHLCSTSFRSGTISDFKPLWIRGAQCDCMIREATSHRGLWTHDNKNNFFLLCSTADGIGKYIPGQGFSQNYVFLKYVHICVCVCAYTYTYDLVTQSRTLIGDRLDSKHKRR